jgi:steroid delta-isomerase-like uncharacterized protein
MQSANAALVRRWFDEVWNQGREATVDELLASNAVVHGTGGDLVGPAGFKPFFRAYRSAFPDVRLRIDELVESGDVVAVRWNATGTHRGDGLGFAPTGRPMQMNGMTFIRVQGNRMVEGWNNFDQLGMLQQLGIVNPEKAG